MKNYDDLYVSIKEKADIKIARNKRNKRIIFSSVTSICIVLVIMFGMTFYLQNNSAHAMDLMSGITRNASIKSELGQCQNSDFVIASDDFSVNLLKQTTVQNKNTVISPVSVMEALGMTSLGADGNTKTQFEKVLGNGLTTDKLAQAYLALSNEMSSISSGKVKLSNSVWYQQNNNSIKKSFLQQNADYFNAAANMIDLQSQIGIDKINSWVKQNTDGLIDKIINQPDKDAVMYLVNTVLFDMEWENIYKTTDISNRDFVLTDNTKISTPFMYSTENIYLENSEVTGFEKPYKDSRYSFVALLPKDNTDIMSCLKNLNGDAFNQLLKTAQTNEPVRVGLPKFKFSFSDSLKKPLINIGLSDAFDEGKANFSGMSSDTGLYVSDVLHKAYIQVDEKGTKAGAATAVIVNKSAIMLGKTVMLDHPFIFAIVDNNTNIPLFMGVVFNPQK